MAANRHLQPKQFKPAHVEGREASDWLSTEPGHQWQDTISRKDRDGNREYGMFVIKDDNGRTGYGYRHYGDHEWNNNPGVAEMRRYYGA